MAGILREGLTGDGYDVLVLSGTESYTLHFTSTPTTAERDAMIAHYEQLHADERVAAEIAENMAEVLG